MEEWQKVCNVLRNESDLEKIREFLAKNFEKYQIYADSLTAEGGSFFCLALVNNQKQLVIFRESTLYSKFNGNEVSWDGGGEKVKICPLDHENCRILRQIFTFTNPTSHQGSAITIGLGDRLGLASPGHLRLIKGLNIFPVLAQQSIRELNLTGRTYEDVLDAASVAVFQEGYTAGFGADGDHLKTPAEVQMALDKGFTMITLDCSEHIHNKVTALPAEEIEKQYAGLPVHQRQPLEVKYLNRDIALGNGTVIRFSKPDLQKIILTYLEAVTYTIDICQNVIKKSGRPIDFEMSIDETVTSTTPEAHYFVASELIDGGVSITSLAPRFYGEFQKGVDYRGDIPTFTAEFAIHVTIANHFGYKISIHSGSDKFSVFPVIGELTGGRYHLKTAGTNWLEAVRIIATKAPALYREIHRFALAHLDEAKRYYHISANPSDIPDLSKRSDHELPGLMEQDDARQTLHITYGLILQAKNHDGTYLFKDRIYQVLNQYESDYYTALEKHIGKHLELLGIPVSH